jgi:hypothetical protein
VVPVETQRAVDPPAASLKLARMPTCGTSPIWL